ncbi:MAG TPA: arylsulfatase, partial [Opitutae bacterium]|nr:arylsulfatase [Opitutae bacterium]
MIQNCFALKKLLFLPALFLLASLSNYGRDAADRPNLILFFLDDSGYGDFAHNGNPTIRTPNITKLTQDGTNFT